MRDGPDDFDELKNYGLMLVSLTPEQIFQDLVKANNTITSFGVEVDWVQTPYRPMESVKLWIYLSK